MLTVVRIVNGCVINWAIPLQLEHVSASWMEKCICQVVRLKEDWKLTNSWRGTELSEARKLGGPARLYLSAAMNSAEHDVKRDFIQAERAIKELNPHYALSFVSPVNFHCVDVFTHCSRFFAHAKLQYFFSLLERFQLS